MTTAIVLPKNHYFLQHAAEIDQLLTPLKQFGITTFSYMRKFSDSSQIYISNNAGWVEDYFGNALYGQFISKPSQQYQNSCIICPTNSSLPVFSLARDRYDSDNVAIFVKSYSEYNDFYFFSGSSSSHHLINFYANQKNLFEKYILYFQDRAETIIRKARNHRILTKQLYLSLDDQLSPTTSQIDSALAEMRIQKYRIKQPTLKDTKISARELDTIFCLIKGMTAKETALQLKISQRTVDDYINNIKAKLFCSNKADILKVLVSDGFPII